jgi:DNA-binding LytR/AlgR family response regulator
MKLSVNQCPDVTETEITITCNAVTPELQALIDRLRALDLTLSGKKDDAWYRVPVEKILYIDSADGRTFLYCANGVFESKNRLFELEEQLKNRMFLRISKNTIVNLHALRHARPLELAKMELLLKNGEKLIVTRHYLNSFKASFGI